MKNKLNIPQEMLMSIDFMNTANGGMSQPIMNIENTEDGYEVMVKAPGIEPDELQIEILKDKLMIYHLLPIFGKSEGESSDMRSIRFISKMQIPADVDVEGISARYDDDRRYLMLDLPADETHKDFHRKVNIERW
ncbi:Hsp20/alpha crystallin family protein [Persicitalea sp.]|uniref:Hsp20/alpha crystallin family protein n=1 Tax=Persicitalea sp. TaxID=3100273 RepID=UPI0035942FE6